MHNKTINVNFFNFLNTLPVADECPCSTQLYIYSRKGYFKKWGFFITVARTLEVKAGHHEEYLSEVEIDRSEYCVESPQA